MDLPGRVHEGAHFLGREVLKRVRASEDREDRSWPSGRRLVRFAPHVSVQNPSLLLSGSQGALG
jgi:hypothetical protein